MNILQTNLTKYQKFFKYIVMTLVVYVSLRYIPELPMRTKEIIMISAISSIMFAILDMISPSIKVNRIEANKELNHQH